MRISIQYLRKSKKMIDYYSQFHPSVLSMQQFLDFGSKDGSERLSFLFLKKELPVRLANIMKEINLLPRRLLEQPSVRRVESWYNRSFDDLIVYENKNGLDPLDLEKFCEDLINIRRRHVDVVETMAQGVIEMKTTKVPPENSPSNLESHIQYFLDRFYLSRISIRMLISQHTLLFGTEIPQNFRQIGSIDPKCNVRRVAEDAFENARFLCEQYYMVSPNCDIITINPTDEKADIQIPYAPSHLYHMLFEIFKNAMRAVVEHHDDNNLPDLTLIICKGDEDVTIKLSDNGGGISRHDVDLLFNYMYSTAPRPPSPSSSCNTPLAGYGYGLPLSRLYAKYFNGDIRLNSVEGYGTDATIYLKVFASDASEFLPVYNSTSVGKYSDTSTPISDWTNPNHRNGLHDGQPECKAVTNNRLDRCLVAAATV